MSEGYCLTHGTYYGSSCRECLADERHEETLAQQRRLAEEQAERDERIINETQHAADRIVEEQRFNIANAHSIQAEALCRDAYSRYRSGLREESLQLAKMSLDLDPTNLVACWVAAASRMALGRYAEGVTFAERHIRLLSLPEFCSSVVNFHYSLELVATRSNPELNSAFADAIQRNITKWDITPESLDFALRIVSRLLKMESVGLAVMVVIWMVSKFSDSETALHSASVIVRLLMSLGEAGHYRRIVAELAPLAKSALQIAFLTDILCAADSEPKEIIADRVQSLQFVDHLNVEKQLVRIHELAKENAISPQAVQIMIAEIQRLYRDWKPALEEEVVKSARILAETAIRPRYGLRVGLAIAGLFAFGIAISGVMLGAFRESSFWGDIYWFFGFGFWPATIAGGIIGGRIVKRRRIEADTRRNIPKLFRDRNATLNSLGLCQLEYASDYRISPPSS